MSRYRASSFGVYVFFIVVLKSLSPIVFCHILTIKKHPHRFEGEKGKNKNERMMQSIRGLDCLKNIIAWFK